MVSKITGVKFGQQMNELRFLEWKKQESTENEPKFYNNYEMACSRLENLEKSLRKKGDRVATE